MLTYQEGTQLQLHTDNIYNSKLLPAKRSIFKRCKRKEKKLQNPQQTTVLTDTWFKKLRISHQSTDSQINASCKVLQMLY